MTVLDSSIRDTQWVGPTDEVVFTLTEAGHVWRSVDGGMSWNDDSAAGLLKGVLDTPPTHGAFQPAPGVQALLFHPDAPNKIWFRGEGEVHWLTEDYGKTYTAYAGPAGHTGIIAIRPHPLEREWFLIMVRRWICWSKDRAARHQCADDLFLTQDFGKTWTNLTASAKGRILSFSDFDWGYSKTVPETPPPPGYTKETILAAVFENRPDVRRHLAQHGTGIQAGWDQYVDFVRSSTLFKTPHVKSVPCGNQFELMNGRLFLAVAEQCGVPAKSRSKGSPSGVRLRVSRDYGASFSDACFPLPLPERGYSVVNVGGDSSFVNVDYAQGPRAAPFGDVFASDANLTLFTLSMRRNARSAGGAVDFAPVQGIPGIYVANQYEENDQQAASKSRPTRAQVGTAEEAEISKTTTKITFNGGATWQTMRPPAKDVYGKPIICEERDGCSLHLYGTTSWMGGLGFAFVYSHASTPGLLISSGNVGRYLYQDSTVNTYLSRDAGQTWEEVAKGARIYEFGDSGGVLVLAQHGFQGPAKDIAYSLDEGLSWQTLPLGISTGINIFNVRVEPDNQGRKFIIQGRAVTNGTHHQGVLVGLNFGEGFPQYKICQPSDYEMWSPTQNHCLLGQNITLQRQVRAAKCWNGDNYKRPPPRTFPCNCQETDYQCDFGYEPVDGKCEPIPGGNPKSCPVIAAREYTFASSHLRAVAGDSCQNHIHQLGSFRVAAQGGGLSWAAKSILVILSLAVMAGGVIVLLARRGMLPDNVARGFPFLERLRYRNVPSSFLSLAEDFGIAGGDDDYLEGDEEMYRRP